MHSEPAPEEVGHLCLRVHGGVVRDGDVGGALAGALLPPTGLDEVTSEVLGKTAGIEWFKDRSGGVQQ